MFPGPEDSSNAPLQPQKSGRSRKTPQPELLPQKSGRSRKTPQPELRPQRSTRRTPAPEDSTLQQSSQRIPDAKETKKRGRPKAIPEIDEGKATENEADKGAPKRRRLNAVPKSKKAAKDAKVLDDVTVPEVQVKDSQATQEDRDTLPKKPVKKRKKRKAIGQQAIRKSRLSGTTPLRPTRQAQKRAYKPEINPPVEPTVPTTPEPPAYSRITTPALQDREQDQFLDTMIPSDAVTQVHDAGLTQDTEAAGPKPRKRKRKLAEAQENQHAKPNVRNSALAESDDLEQSTPQQVKPKPKRGRKPKAEQKALDEVTKKRKPAERLPAELVQPVENSVEPMGEASAVAPDQANVPGQEVPKEQHKPRRKKRKSIGQQSLKSKRKSTSLGTPSKPPDNEATGLGPRAALKHQITQPPIHEQPDELPNETQEPDESHPDPIPPKKKRGRPRKADSVAPASAPPPTFPPQPRTQKPKPRAPPKNTIPITYYAAPSPSTTPSPLTTLPHPKTINAPNVLSQITLELLSKTSAQLSQNALSDPALSAEYTSRQKTLDMYAEELEERLFHLSRVLNENVGLNKRVMERVAEERTLKKEIKEVKAQREEVAARKSAILKGRKEKKLETLLSGIGKAVKKGWEMEDAGGEGAEA